MLHLSVGRWTLSGMPVWGRLGNTSRPARSRRKVQGFEQLEARNLLAAVFNPIGVNPLTPHPVAGQSALNELVAVFTAPETLPSTTATIDWGDGHATPGTIVQSGLTTFDVFGTHTYTDATIPGSPENIVVTINDVTDSPSNPPALIDSTAIVDDAPITNVSGVPFFAIRETATPDQQVVATFGSGNAFASSSSFAATINWGDGTPTTPGFVVEDASKVFHVEGSHTYASTGQFPVSVSILSAGGSSAATPVPTIANVSNSTVILAPIGVNTPKGANFSGSLATFIPAPGTAALPAIDYTATISWGDGSAPSRGVITPIDGSFVVTGLHRYATAGVFPIDVTIHDLAHNAFSQVFTQATVIPVGFTLTGQLNSASDNGASHHDAITTVRRPNFLGTSQPGSTVSIFATPVGRRKPVALGKTQANPDGSWSLTSRVALPYGRYVVTASALGTDGLTSETIQILPNASQGDLTIAKLAKKKQA
jgi:hypothetical protein